MTQAARGTRRSRDESAAALLIVAHVAVALTMSLVAKGVLLRDDVARFVELATTPGMPYRDFPVEYAPLETLFVRLVFRTDLQVALGRLAVLSLVCDIGIFLVLRRFWGLRQGVVYLAISLPMQIFMPFRLDLLPVLLAVAGVGMSGRGRERTGGALLGAAILSKVWPLVVVPALLIKRCRAAVAMSVFVVVLGVSVWIAVAGVDSVRQVASFREASGWQIESTVGAIVWVVTASPVRLELGATRVGSSTTWEVIALGAGAATVIAGVWWRARREGVDPAGLPAAASVATLAVFSPVASAQYVAWIIPWVAIAAIERSRPAVAGLAFAASVLAAAVFLVYWNVVDTGGLLLLQVFALTRALCLIGIVIAWFAESRPGRAHA